MVGVTAGGGAAARGGTSRVPAARAALMAMLSMGWMEEDEAVDMGEDQQACVEREQAASISKKTRPTERAATIGLF